MKHTKTMAYIMLAVVLCTGASAKLLFGGDTVEWNISKQPEINATINASSVIDAGEFTISPCTQLNTTRYVCNTSQTGKISFHILPTTVNNYTIILQYGSTIVVKDIPEDQDTHRSRSGRSSDSLTNWSAYLKGNRTEYLNLSDVAGNNATVIPPSSTENPPVAPTTTNVINDPQIPGPIPTINDTNSSVVSFVTTINRWWAWSILGILLITLLVVGYVLYRRNKTENNNDYE